MFEHDQHEDRRDERREMRHGGEGERRDHSSKNTPCAHGQTQL